MSRLEDAIAAGRFIVTAELLTVNAGGLDAVHARFEPFEDYVDATNATDNTAAHAHASPLAVAIALMQLGMEPVMQLTCRDRNRLALEAEIAGAALHGIENICCLTGDDVTAGNEPEARRVFDLDSIQLIGVAEGMRNGGRRCKSALAFRAQRRNRIGIHSFLGTTSQHLPMLPLLETAENCEWPSSAHAV